MYWKCLHSKPVSNQTIMIKHTSHRKITLWCLLSNSIICNTVIVCLWKSNCILDKTIKLIFLPKYKILSFVLSISLSNSLSLSFFFEFLLVVSYFPLITEGFLSWRKLIIGIATSAKYLTIPGMCILIIPFYHVSCEEFSCPTPYKSLRSSEMCIFSYILSIYHEITYDHIYQKHSVWHR